jgi:flagellar biosynthesis protein FlhG
LNSQADELKELVGSLKTKLDIKILAITSGKGGVGKSTISANLGHILSKLGLRVAIFDADFGLANLDIMFNVRCSKNILDIINGKASLDDIIVKINKNLILIPGDSGDEILKHGSQLAFDRLYQEFKTLKDIDIMIIDTGAGINTSTQNFLKSANEVVVIVTPDPSSITDAYATIKVSSKDTNNIFLLLNNTANDKEARLIFDKILKVSKQNIPNLTLNYLGSLNSSRVVSSNVLKRTLFSEVEPYSKSSIELTNIAKNMLPHLEHNVLIDNENAISRLLKNIIGRF